MNNCAQTTGGVIIVKRLYITDLDGTLLDPSGHITSETAAAVSALVDRGMYFSAATARSVYSARPITSAIRFSAPCILLNGVCIYDMVQGRYIKNEYIPTQTSREIIRAFRENGVRCFMFRIEDDVLTAYFTAITQNVMRSFAEERKNRFGKPFVQLDDMLDMADDRAVYFTTTGEHDILAPVAEAARGIPGADMAFYEDTYTGKWYLEMFAHTASKANGVKFLREKYGFDEVVCFGDNLNDLPMFAQSDVRVAVGNAKPEVKAAADYIAPPNTEDGVAKWLLDNYI